MSSSRSNHRARVAPMMLAGFLSGAAPSVLAQSPTPAVAPELTGASTALPAITVVARPAEMLEAGPGLIVSQHSGEGKANQYFLRGMNLDHGTDLALWLDGMPLNMRTHGHGQGYADINFLIPELVTSLTVKKGPYWAEEGDFSSAGTVRLA